MVVRYYSSTAAETQLTGTISPTALSINVLDVTGFPVSYPYTLAIDYESASEELVDVTAAAGGTLTVTRAVDGTSATSHSTGARVRHVSSARDFRDSRNHENSDSGVHGLTGDVVGTSDTQILTNKTLSSPVFAGTASGVLTGDTSFRVRLPNTTDVSPTSTNHAFQIGPDVGRNMRMDNNEIMVVDSGVPGTILINADGGAVWITSNLAADTSTNTLVVTGGIDANVYYASRASSTANVITFKADADTQFRYNVRSDGRTTWGPGGSSAADTGFYRSDVSTLTVQNNLNVVNAFTAAQGTLGTLTVTGPTTFTPVVSTGASVAVAQTGWSLSSAQAVVVAGTATLQVTMTRTGANIVTPSTGNIPDTPMVQINGFLAPNSNLGDLHFAASSSAGVGAAYIASGIVSIQSWVPSQTIATGDNISFTLTYAL